MEIYQKIDKRIYFVVRIDESVGGGVALEQFPDMASRGSAEWVVALSKCAHFASSPVLPSSWIAARGCPYNIFSSYTTCATRPIRPISPRYARMTW